MNKAAIAEIIARAIIDARSICLREHIKADRIERVGIFITCLRRDLMGNWLVDNLTKKSVWHDIGELSANYDNRISWLNAPVKKTTIQEIVVSAIMKADANKEDPVGQMEFELDALKSSLGYFDLQHGRVDRLLEDADKLADELVDALKE